MRSTSRDQIRNQNNNIKIHKVKDDCLDKLFTKFALYKKNRNFTKENEKLFTIEKKVETISIDKRKTLTKDHSAKQITQLSSHLKLASLPSSTSLNVSS